MKNMDITTDLLLTEFCYKIMEKGIQTLYCKEIISFDEHNDLIKKISD
jgi:hypothetical protein